MDILKIGRIQPLPQTSGTKKSAESGEREPNQGGNGYQNGREEPASSEEAKKAAGKLEKSAHFTANALSVEVREAEGKFFLDIFDPQKRKIKSIGAIGIRAILSSYNGGENSDGRILDRRV